MPTFLAKIFRKKKLKTFFFSNSGFTLIEILAVLALIGIMTGIGVRFINSNKRDVLDTAKEELVRAIRYASNEAVINNKLVRIKFKLDVSPQQYLIEISAYSDLLLPEADTEQTSKNKSLKDEESEKKELGTFDKSFSAADNQGDKELEIDVKVVALGYPGNEKITTQGDFSIYFYPSGERDNALIVIQGDLELMTLEIEPFRERVNDFYQTLDPQSMGDVQYGSEPVLKKAEELIKGHKNNGK